MKGGVRGRVGGIVGVIVRGIVGVIVRGVNVLAVMLTATEMDERGRLGAVEYGCRRHLSGLGEAERGRYEEREPISVI